MAILLALSMPVVVGGLGLGTEVGAWYLTERKLQNAADIAAFAAAAEIRAGRVAEAAGAAERAAVAAGFAAGSGEIAVTTPYGDSAKRVEVRLRETKARVFTALFGDDRVEMGARAVAQIEAPTGVACILALNGTAKGALAFGGNAGGQDGTVLGGCTMHANSLNKLAVTVGNSVKVEAECLSAAGGVDTLDPDKFVLKSCGAPIHNAPVIPDPFASTPAPTSAEPCSTQTSFSGGEIAPGRYCGGLSIQGPVTMLPGVYIVEGDFSVNATAVLTGDDVLIYLKGSNSRIKMNGTATVELSGRLSEPYAGMVMFVDGAAVGGKHNVNGNNASSIDGAIYAPTGEVAFSGNMNGGDACTRIVADTILFTGNSSVGIVCSSDNLLEIEAVERVRLVE